MDEIKLCECGCGNPTPIAKRTTSMYGHIKGKPHRFIIGHYSRTQEFKNVMAKVDTNITKHIGENNGNWKGGRYISSSGYVYVKKDDTYVYEHRIVAEEKLGRPLNKGEVIHHVNGDKSDNSPDNIIVFSNHSEHMKFHMTSDRAREIQKKRYGPR